MTSDLNKCMELIRAAKQDGPHMDRVMRALEKVYNLPADDTQQGSVVSFRLTEAYSLLLMTLDELPPDADKNRSLIIAAMKAVSRAKDSLCHPDIDREKNE